MLIPSKKQCYQLIQEMKMLDHIVAHSFRVSQVATFLVDNMNARQLGLSRNLVEAASLLHDITKTRSFKTKENHARTGCEFLAGIGYPEVGNIVGQHVRLDDHCAAGVPVEAEVVNYADKRVLHDKVVPLKERMLYVLNNYGRLPEFRHRIHRLWEETERLEERLFGYLPFLPEELDRQLGYQP